MIDAAISGLRALLDADPMDQRQAMQALLGNQRLRVREDTQRGFRVEGMLRLDLNDEAPEAGRPRVLQDGSGEPLRPGLPARSGALADPGAPGRSGAARLDA